MLRVSAVAADPYGTCSGTWTDDLPCSWEYGYERANADMSDAVLARRTACGRQDALQGAGERVVITQYVSTNLDYDYSCV